MKHLLWNWDIITLLLIMVNFPYIDEKNIISYYKACQATIVNVLYI